MTLIRQSIHNEYVTQRVMCISISTGNYESVNGYVHMCAYVFVEIKLNYIDCFTAFFMLCVCVCV